MSGSGCSETCDTTLHAHAGPLVGHIYRHRLRHVAEALVAVGHGVSCTHASNKARAAAGRNPSVGADAGQLVAEWLDFWAPVVIDAHAETDWAETLVLDSTDFWRTNARTPTRRREFAIPIAYGYPGPRARNQRPQVWGTSATATARAAH